MGFRIMVFEAFLGLVLLILGVVRARMTSAGLRCAYWA